MIIPTFNRCKSLKEVLVSLQKQNFPSNQYEIIVVDNNSTDSTKELIKEFNTSSKKIKYVFEPEMGLHNGRHNGAKAASGKILAYVDDDVICDPNWLSELIKPYNELNVGAVGGKIIPQFESEPPEWVKYFPSYLSLLDISDEVKKIDYPGIYGCNFSIRKNVLFETGGFNPDSLPWDLIEYRGDGETGLLKKVLDHNYEIIYNPFAVVTHITPKNRLNNDYLEKRAFIEGISASYSEIRNNGKIINKKSFYSKFSGMLRYLKYYKYIIRGNFNFIHYNEIVIRNFKKGKAYHHKKVSENKNLLKYVVKKTYMDK